MDRTTVYPSRAGRFPAASFRTFAEALRYAREISDNRPPCGICMCPAPSYAMHYPDTLYILNNHGGNQQ